MRWRAHHHTNGTGHLYQGRFKSFPIQAHQQLCTVLRYVERNALRANLVKRPEDLARGQPGAEGGRLGDFWRLDGTGGIMK